MKRICPGRRGAAESFIPPGKARCSSPLLPSAPTSADAVTRVPSDAVEARRRAL